MDEVFLQAALGSPISFTFPAQTHTPSTGDKHQPKRKSPWSIFEVSELESKSVCMRLPPTDLSTHARYLGETDR